MRLADSISLRSRQRKLRLLLDELRPTAETSVLDVGADELGFGEGDVCGTMNFFEEHYPWPERITALGLHDGEGFRARHPDIRYVQGDACALPFDDAGFDVVEATHRAGPPKAMARHGDGVGAGAAGAAAATGCRGAHREPGARAPRRMKCSFTLP